jgi:hypothetical protein
LRDGRISYRMKKSSRRVSRCRTVTPVEFIARLCALVPPPRCPLSRFHGVLACTSAPDRREPRRLAAGFIRIGADGSQDMSYGTNGLATVTWSNAPTSTGHGFRADGRLYGLGGIQNSGQGQERLDAFFQFTKDGLLDPSFGTRGVTTSRRTPASPRHRDTSGPEA